jgi:peptide/nickel transport system substrate-binding protein
MRFINKYTLLLTISLRLVSCGFLDDKRVITQEIDFFPSGLDPAKNIEFSEYQILSQIYEPLLTLKDDYHTLLPCLAETWSISKDNLEYTFHLRPDVQFHDGSLLTASAAQLSFMRQIRIRQEEYPPFSIIDTIRCTDPMTLQIKLKHPYAPFIYSLASPFGLLAISQNALEKFGDDIDKNPVGTGPFFLNQWHKNKVIELQAFVNYRERSTIKKISFISHDSASQSIQQFENEELDILYMVAAHWLDRLKWMGRIDYFVQKPINTIYLGFNLKNNPVDNIAVRKAILLAMDNERSVIKSNRGNAIPAEGPLPPSFKGFDDLRQSRYDPVLARKFLEDAGFLKGLMLNIYVFSPAYSRQMKIELIKSQLAKIGITLHTKFFEKWELFVGALAKEECHLFLHGYGAELIGDPGNFLFALFHSTSPGNHVNYSNRYVDQLLEQAFHQPDEQKRHEIYRSIVEIILNDTPAIFDSHVKSHFAYNSEKIKSLVVNPYDFIYFHRLETYE